MTLGRDDVACLAVVPKRMKTVRTGDLLEIQVRDPRSGLLVQVCDAAGKPLAQRSPGAKKTLELNLKQVSPGGAKPVCVKLMNGPRMLDLARL